MRLGRHRGKFCAVWYEGGERFRRSLGTDDADEAKRRLAEFQSIQQRAQSLTVGEIFSRYADRKATPRIDFAWNRLKPHFAALAPEHVTQDICHDYIAARRECGAGDGTINTEMLYLAAALNDAEKRSLIDRAPFVPKPAKPRPRDRRLSRAEARKLIDAAEMPHVKLVIRLMLGTAARIGSLLDLTWDRVDFEHGMIRLDNPARAQTNKQRATVPMNKSVRAALIEAKKAALTDHVIEWGGREVNSIKKGFRRACERAKLDDVTPHTLRHTAATWMAEAGVPMDEIAQYLGHTDSRTTYRVYARYSPHYLRKASAALEF